VTRENHPALGMLNVVFTRCLRPRSTLFDAVGRNYIPTCNENADTCVIVNVHLTCEPQSSAEFPPRPRFEFRQRLGDPGVESSSATGWHKEKLDVVRVGSCKDEIGPVAWIYIEVEDERISFGHFAMQPFDVGDDKPFRGPSAVYMADDDYTFFRRAN
jgi:hypothetical protein